MRLAEMWSSWVLAHGIRILSFPVQSKATTASVNLYRMRSLEEGKCRLSITHISVLSRLSQLLEIIHSVLITQPMHRPLLISVNPSFL
jgi:hypothetical protein